MTLAEQANSTVSPVLALLAEGGLYAATRSLAIEFATRGIRVHAVSLGIAKTPIDPAATYTALAAMNPVGTSASFVTGEFIKGPGRSIVKIAGPSLSTRCIKTICGRWTDRRLIMHTDRKVAVITGASQGIGAALVAAFRERDYVVVATARSAWTSPDEDIAVVAGDIRERQTARRVVAEAMGRFGRIDTLVNNAGVFLAKPFTNYTEDDFDAALGVNVAGFFYMTQLAVQEMEKTRGGHIVQISTTLAEQANSTVPSVLASLTKGGLNAATRSLAIEFATRGIRVNAVSPGIVKTPMHPADTYAALAAMHPVGRMGEISDVVGAVLYLESAPFVTGEILHVDGGQSAGH